MMYSEDPFNSFGRPVHEFHFLKVSRLDVAKQKSYTWPSNRFHGPEIWKSWNFPKYWRWWTAQAFKITKFVRWRDFNALRRAHVSFTWLVEWLHRRVISSAGAIGPRIGVMEFIRFGTLTSIFDIENDVIRNSDRIVLSAGAWISFSESITAGRWETNKLYENTHLSSWGRIWKIMKFSKKVTLAGGWGL